MAVTAPVRPGRTKRPVLWVLSPKIASKMTALNGPRHPQSAQSTDRARNRSIQLTNCRKTEVCGNVVRNVG